MGTVKVSVDQVKEMTSTQLRQLASEMKIKSYAKFKKEELMKVILDQISQPKVSKSALLRKEIKESLNKGFEIDSGSLMKRMREKYDTVMHRSFIITVRNTYLELIGQK